MDRSLLNTAALHTARGMSSEGSRNPTFKVLIRSRGKMGPTQIKHSLKTKMTCPYTHILVDNHLQPLRLGLGLQDFAGELEKTSGKVSGRRGI